MSQLGKEFRSKGNNFAARETIAWRRSRAVPCAVPCAAGDNDSISDWPLQWPVWFLGKPRLQDMQNCKLESHWPWRISRRKACGCLPRTKNCGRCSWNSCKSIAAAQMARSPVITWQSSQRVFRWWAAAGLKWKARPLMFGPQLLGSTV